MPPTWCIISRGKRRNTEALDTILRPVKHPGKSPLQPWPGACTLLLCVLSDCLRELRRGAHHQEGVRSSTTPPIRPCPFRPSVSCPSRSSRPSPSVHVHPVRPNHVHLFCPRPSRPTVTSIQESAKKYMRIEPGSKLFRLITSIQHHECVRHLATALERLIASVLFVTQTNNWEQSRGTTDSRR